MTKQTSPKTRSGFVALLGAPNTGKSTLLNQMVGEKLSIVSHKAQTTRMRVLGLLTEGNTQIGFIDTPGIFEPKGRMDKAMVAAAWESLEDADVIVFMVDPCAKQPDAQTEAILEILQKQQRRAILVLNKVDKVSHPKLLPLAERLHDTAIFDKIFMISALTGDGVAELKSYLHDAMPEGPWHYPEDQVTDLPERLLAAEITREQLYHQLHDELPYDATVLPEAWEEKKDGSLVVRQVIVITRPNQRAIVLGKNGARIKAIGEAARAELTKILDRPVHLFLQVKVVENWQERGTLEL